MGKRVDYTKQAMRDLRRMPRNESQRVMDKIDQYAEDPAAQANNVKALRGRDGYRLRVGDWRVIFADSDDTVIVLRVRQRGSAY